MFMHNQNLVILMNIFLMFDMAMAAIHQGLWDRTWGCVNHFPLNIERQNSIYDLAHMFDIVEKYSYYYQAFRFIFTSRIFQRVFL